MGLGWQSGVWGLPPSLGQEGGGGRRGGVKAAGPNAFPGDLLQQGRMLAWLFHGGKAQVDCFIAWLGSGLCAGEGLGFPGLCQRRAVPQTYTLGFLTPAQPFAGQAAGMVSDHPAPFTAGTVAAMGWFAWGACFATAEHPSVLAPLPIAQLPAAPWGLCQREAAQQHVAVHDFQQDFGLVSPASTVAQLPFSTFFISGGLSWRSRAAEACEPGCSPP